MSKKKDIHVVPRADGGWATKRLGAGRASDRHETQQDAINVGRVSAKRDRVELVIHGKNGQICEKDSCGNDPCPPKDRKH